MTPDMLLVATGVAQGVAAGAIGVFAGAMLTEAGVLVPYWRSIDARTFHGWYVSNAGRLLHYFGRLTWVAGLSALTAAVLSVAAADGGGHWAVTAAVLMLMIVGLFPLYFKDANAALASGLSSEATARAINRWSVWHRVRVGMSLGALAAEILAL